MSAADLMAVLLCNHLRYDFANPKNPNNDHLIFSKGHASPLLYSFYKAAGAIDDAELMTLRKDGSRLEGHPVPVVLPWVDVATGSLGQGLPIGVGVAISGKYLEKLDYKVWVLCGDSEMAEGSMWEALEHASFYKLGNLIAILDMNRLGQRGPTMHQWDGKVYADRARAFGCHVIEIDGHDVEQIDRAYSEAAKQTDKPTFIVAKTVKGSGVEEIANKLNWHGKALPPDLEKKAIAELGGERHHVVTPIAPPPGTPRTSDRGHALTLPTFDKPIATREAYGKALKALGDVRKDVVALDGEVGNSTFTDIFTEAHPDHSFEMYIAEQMMVSAAVGLQVREWVAFAATFAAFLSRAYDFIRMAAISRAHLRLCGSHAGVSIGEDGPSQMALEDLAMMRAVYGSTVLYPSDGVSAAKLTFAMADIDGISYMRTTREKTPILYKPEEAFPIGGSKTLRSSEKDVATVIGAGITLHNALKAYDTLQQEGVSIRVIDLYSVKPVDDAALAKAAKETGHLIVVEDHWPEGGLGEAVLSSLAASGTQAHVVKMGVQGMPGSATPEQLMDHAGISAGHIVDAVRKLK
jgi:transketolase